jgi:anti-anti-sigma factor
MDELAGSDAELVVVDLRGLEFMDSTGLHLLLQAQQQAQDSGRRLVLVRGPDAVQRLFDLTGVAEALTIVDSPTEVFEAHGAP